MTIRIHTDMHTGTGAVMDPAMAAPDGRHNTFHRPRNPNMHAHTPFLRKLAVAATVLTTVIAAGASLAAPAAALAADAAIAPGAARSTGTGTDTGAADVMTAGEIRKMDSATNKLTIRHERIDNLDMAAMTMVFRVADPALLAGLGEGAAVRFHAERIDGVLTVTRIVPAP